MLCCSFDETYINGSQALPTVIEGRINDYPQPVKDVEVTSLEEAKSIIAALRARERAQAHQMLAWRRTLKLKVKILLHLIYSKQYLSGQLESLQTFM